MAEAVGLRARRALVEAMRILHMRGLVNLRGGNASVRVEMGPLTYVYVTPKGVAKPFMDVSDIAVVSPEGRIVEGEPTSELKLHLEVYRVRSDVRAVVHAHNPLTVAAVELISVEELLKASVESKYYIGDCIGVVPYYEPGSQELAKATAEALKDCNAAILRMHGAVAVGVSRDPFSAVMEAVDRLEALEDAAKIILARRCISTPR